MGTKHNNIIVDCRANNKATKVYSRIVRSGVFLELEGKKLPNTRIGNDMQRGS